MPHEASVLAVAVDSPRRRRAAVAALRRRSSRVTLLAARSDHAGERAQLAIAWEWKPNEKVLPQFGTRPGRVSEHAARHRQRDVPQHAVQPGRRARCRQPARNCGATIRKPTKTASRPTARASRIAASWRGSDWLESPSHLPQRALQADSARREDRHAGHRRSARTASSI